MAICVGCGLTPDGDPVGVLKVQRRPCGAIGCDNSGDADDGLYVKTRTNGGIVVDCTDGLVLDARVSDSSTVDLGGSGTLAVPLTAAVKLSTTDCNALSVVGNGLYVPCSDGVVGVSLQTSPQNVGTTEPTGQPMGAVASYDYLNDNAFNSIHVTNPTCCTLDGFVEVTVGDTYLIADVGFLGNAHLDVNINNGGFSTVSPDSQRIFHNVGNSAQRMDADNIGTTLFVSLGAGASADYQWRLRFDATVGTAHLHTLSSGPKFYTRWMLTHTNCCDHIG